MQGRHTSKSLAVVLPAYNESNQIESCVRRLISAFPEGYRPIQLIVVDDGSNDGTKDVLRQLALELKMITLIEHSRNRGKGRAIRTGLEHVKADWVVIQDADLEYDPKDLVILIDRMRQGDVDVVYGSRCLAQSVNPRRFNLFAWGVSLLNLTVRCLYRTRLTDEATCYKLFRTIDLRRMNLQCERFEFCPEVTAKAIRLGLGIVEVPISYQPRNHTEGKKIRLSDGVEAIKVLWRYRKWVEAPPPQTAFLAQEAIECER